MRDGHSAADRGETQTATEIRAALATALEVLGCAPDPGVGTELVGPLVEMLLAEREHARASKDFAHADEIRQRLTDIGVRIEDSPSGPRWFVE